MTFGLPLFYFLLLSLNLLVVVFLQNLNVLVFHLELVGAAVELVSPGRYLLLELKVLKLDDLHGAIPVLVVGLDVFDYRLLPLHFLLSLFD